MTDKIIETGGHAFPIFPPENHAHVHTGMTLRDYFAAKAMQGDWAAQDEAIGTYQNSIKQSSLEERAALYYRMADAMIKARGNA